MNLEHFREILFHDFTSYMLHLGTALEQLTIFRNGGIESVAFEVCLTSQTSEQHFHRLISKYYFLFLAVALPLAGLFL